MEVDWDLGGHDCFSFILMSLYSKLCKMNFPFVPSLFKLGTHPGPSY
jgi:hypothetical protein